LLQNKDQKRVAFSVESSASQLVARLYVGFSSQFFVSLYKSPLNMQTRVHHMRKLINCLVTDIAL